MSEKELTKKEEMDEKNVISRCKKGEESAFALIIDKYQTRIYNIILSVVKNLDDAKDITQEAFMQIHGSIKNFKGLSSFSTWVYRVTLNTAYKYLRDNKKQRETISINEPFINEKGKEHYLEIPDESDDPLKLFEEKQVQERLKDAFLHLPEEYRTAVLLRFKENMSYVEIAEVLKCPLGSVKSKLHNGLVLLAKYMKKQAEAGKNE